MKSYFWLFSLCFIVSCASNDHSKWSNEKIAAYQEGIKCELGTKYSLEKRRQMFPFNKAKKVLAIAYYNLSVLGRNYLDVLDETKMDTIMDGEGNPFVIPRLKKGKNYRSVEGANEWTFLNVDTTQTFKIRPNYYATESIELNSNQIDTLSNLLFNYELNKKSFYSYEVGCYSPRNAFLFLNEKGKIVGIVEICFECMKMVFSFEEEYGFDGICYERKAAIKSFLAGLGIKYGLETK